MMPCREQDGGGMSEQVPVSVGRSIVAALACSWALAGFVTLVIYMLVSGDAPVNDAQALTFETILPYIAIGFAAQLVDGSLGIGFGIITGLALAGLGVPTTLAATSIRTVEGFVCGASALSHVWFRNVDWRIFSLLVTPGIVGSLAGAFLASRFDISFARLAVYLYLIVVSGLVLWRIWRGTMRSRRSEEIGVLGLAGGFFDMAGGAGWGPVVAGNLLLQGVEPRRVVGTVAVSEFFVTIAISVLLIGVLGTMAFTTAAIGLLIGGVAAAPLAAFVTRQIEARWLALAIAGLLLVLATGGLARFVGLF